MDGTAPSGTSSPSAATSSTAAGAAPSASATADAASLAAATAAAAAAAAASPAASAPAASASTETAAAPDAEASAMHLDAGFLGDAAAAAAPSSASAPPPTKRARTGSEGSGAASTSSGAAVVGTKVAFRTAEQRRVAEALLWEQTAGLDDDERREIFEIAGLDFDKAAASATLAAAGLPVPEKKKLSLRSYQMKKRLHADREFADDEITSLLIALRGGNVVTVLSKRAPQLLALLEVFSRAVLEGAPAADELFSSLVVANGRAPDAAAFAAGAVANLRRGAAALDERNANVLMQEQKAVQDAAKAQDEFERAKQEAAAAEAAAAKKAAEAAATCIANSARLQHIQDYSEGVSAAHAAAADTLAMVQKNLAAKMPVSTVHRNVREMQNIAYEAAASILQDYLTQLKERQEMANGMETS
jgi:hypothetical protein